MPKRFWVVVGFTLLICMGFPNWAYGQEPDLIISRGPLGSLQVIRSQNDTVTVTLQNVGSDTVKTQFDVTVYLSADTILGASDRVVGDVAIASMIAQGDSVLVKIPVRVPSLLTLGAYKWLAKVDGANLIVESNEGNNVSVGNSVLVVAPPSDLVILSGPVGPSEVNLNGNYTITLNFQNQGAGPTQNVFEIAIFLSADSMKDGADVEVGRTTVSDKVFENTSRSVQLSVVIPQSHILGNFKWLAVIDVANAESESLETNNVRVGNATGVVEKLADLIISAPPSGPNGVFRRGTYDVSTQIKNQGTGSNTSDFDVVIYLSEDLIAGNSDDVRVGDVAISGVLGVDSTQTLKVPVTIPALQTYRSYQWIAVVDEVGFVSELNETNNSLIGSAVSVVPSPPDLTIENVVGSTPVERSHVYDIRLDVVNQGDGVTTGAFQVSLLLTVDDSIGNADDVRVGNATVTDILSSGDRKSVAFSMTIPSQQAIGTYRLVAVADASNIETETNETNNTTFSSVPVDVVPSPPDLIFVTDPSGKERVFRGVIDTVMVQIRNQGVGDASGAFDVFAFLSVDAVADSADTQVGALRIEQGILAGQTIDVAIPIVVPPEQALGAYRFWARLDANRALNESDETNNERVGVAVSVVNFPPDVTIFDDIVTPSLVARGGVYQISVPVRNVGTGPATLGFQVEVYLSEDERLDTAVDILAGGRKFSDSFASGSEQIALVPVSIPLDLPTASYRWIARVAVVGLQDESDASNNIRPGNPVVFPVMTVDPSALDFGTVRVGGARSLTFEILNGGTARLSFEIETSDPSLTVKPQSVVDLPPGVPWKVTVTYTPTSAEEISASLNIKSNDPEGGGQMAISGRGEIPVVDRMFLDFDPAEGNQGKTKYNAFAQESVVLSVVMNDMPTLTNGTIVMHYDSLKLAFVDSSWVPQGLFLGATTSRAQVVEPGVLALEVSSVSGFVGGSGLLGQLGFRTLPTFVPNDVGSVSIQQFQYQAGDSSRVSMEVTSEASIQFGLACWADIHGDSLVDINDFITFIGAFDRSVSDPGWSTELANFPSPKTPYQRFDANADGMINLSDFLLLTQVFGQRCVR